METFATIVTCWVGLALFICLYAWVVHWSRAFTLGAFMLALAGFVSVVGLASILF